jgi:putative pyruvate formate lyase activating enzyme
VDIYLPDFKYGNEEDAFLFSGARDYPVYALSAIREMIRQCGDDLILDGDIATRGVIIRHLVLPGKIRNSFEVLDLIERKLSKSVPVSIMSQYTPVVAVEKHPLLGRRITANEYESVVEYALDLGLETIFTQEVDESDLIPDFNKEDPFAFKR